MMNPQFKKKKIVIIGIIIILLLAWTLGNLSVSYFSMEGEDLWRGDETEVGDSGRSPAGYIDISKYIIDLAVGAVFVFASIGILISPTEELKKKAGQLFFTFIGVIVAWNRDLIRSYIFSIDLPEINLPSFPNISFGEVIDPIRSSQATSNISGIGVLLFLVTVLVFTFLLFRRMESSSEDSKDKEENISKTADRALEELHEGKNVRDVIIRNYQKMCLILERKGVNQEISYTPRELENKALNQLSLKEKTIDKMTKLFEEAKYSDHPLKEKERDRAIENFKQIRDQLGGE